MKNKGLNIHYSPTLYMNIENIIKKSPIIAIFRNVDDSILFSYAESLLNGGITAIEVALNSQNPIQQIKTLHEHFGADLTIGAGTAITQEKIINSKNAGASFFLTPSVNKTLLDYYYQMDLILLPRVFSPSDVALCLEYSYHTMKLFPAGDLPLSYIKTSKAPLMAQTMLQLAV